MRHFFRKTKLLVFLQMKRFSVDVKNYVALNDNELRIGGRSMFWKSSVFF